MRPTPELSAHSQRSERHTGHAACGVKKLAPHAVQRWRTSTCSDALSQKGRVSSELAIDSTAVGAVPVEALSRLTAELARLDHVAQRRGRVEPLPVRFLQRGERAERDVEAV